MVRRAFLSYMRRDIISSRIINRSSVSMQCDRRCSRSSNAHSVHFITTQITSDSTRERNLIRVSTSRGIQVSLMLPSELGQADNRYLRALAAFYIRLTFRSIEVYEILEPLMKDYRKLRIRHVGMSSYYSYGSS